MSLKQCVAVTSLLHTAALLVVPMVLTGCAFAGTPDGFFSDTKIHRIEVVMDTVAWNHVTAQLGERFGRMRGGPMGFGGDKRSERGGERDGRPRFMEHPGGLPPMPPFVNGGTMPDSLRPGQPMEHAPGPNGNQEWDFLPCKVRCNGREWDDVGFKLKGNSSLMHTWMEQRTDYPFRLKFAKYQKSGKNETPNLFFGMEKLSFSNGLKDRTRIREKLAADLFAKANVPVARTVLCEVYFVVGCEARYAGVYTAVEIVEDTMLKHCFGTDSGNCYKPDGAGATFAKGSFDETAFVKKNNKKTGFDDVAALYRVLHDSLRLTHPDQWERHLEKVFDVDGFLKWLAVNSTMLNWDTYGNMAHNYYLYRNPRTGKLTWIPWDNNEALSYGGMGGQPDIAHANVGIQWPLISYLLSRPTYRQTYRNEVATFSKEVFTPRNMEKLIDHYQHLLLSVDSIKNNPADIRELRRGFADLKDFVDERQQEISKFFGNWGY